MNVPTNCREFSLALAQQNHPLVTRDGREAKFIAYVPEAVEDERVIVLVGNHTQLCFEDGLHSNSIAYDLFLAPLGYCEGKPVFAGDVLLYHPHKGSPKEWTVTVEYSGDIQNSTWPSKAPVVETRMTRDDLHNSYCENSLFDVANDAIERAIADGDVIPTSVVKGLMCDVFDKHTMTFGNSFKDDAQVVLNEYLGRMKK